MKKILCILLALVMILSLCACQSKPAEQPAEQPAEAPAEQPAEKPAEAPAEQPASPAVEEVKGVTIPNFTITVNGVTVDQNAMANYPMYSVKATSINSSGTESTVTYQGFKMTDVFDAAGLTDKYVWLEAVADDGYSIDFTDADLISADTTLLAMTKDGSPFSSSPWFAPCADQTTGNYLKGCTTILVNTTEGKPEIAEQPAEAPAEQPAANEGGLPEISDKTDKVKFGDYSFKVNGTDVTNATLEGLNIYKISVSPLNKKGEVVEATYTGYKLLDVLKACGVENPTSVKVVANDGYESDLASDLITSDYTLVAIEKDKETGEDGTIWVAPCTMTENNKYSKLVVEIKAE